MRILLITDNHTPTGGAENYFFDLKKRLKNVPSLEVYSIGFGPTAAAGEDYSILKGLRSKAAKFIWQIFFHPKIFIELRRQIKKFNPDVIHLHNVKNYAFSLLWAVKSYPIVQTMHDYSTICPIAYNIHKNYQPCSTGIRASCFWQHQVKYNPLVYLALTYAFYKTRNRLKKIVKKFFAPSPLLVEYLKKNNFNDVTYIAPFKKEPKPYCFDKIKPFHFLFAGNLGAHKGIYLLLDEFALAHQKNKQLTLTIAGAGPELQRMQKRVKNLGLEKNIFFPGWIQNLDEEYTQCAAVIFPSLWLEAFGLIISEAMSHAKPIIGSDRGSPIWLIDDKQTGLIFNPLKKGDLAEKLLILAGNLPLITTLGQNGYKKLFQLIDNEKILKQIISLYKDAIDGTSTYVHEKAPN